MALLSSFFLNDDGAGVGLRPCRIVRGLLRRRRLLGVCAVARGQAKTKEEQQNRGSTASSQERSHHLQLYSVPLDDSSGSWATAFAADGVHRSGSDVSKENDKEQIPPLVLRRGCSSLVDVITKRKTRRLVLSLVTAAWATSGVPGLRAQAVSSTTTGARVREPSHCPLRQLRRWAAGRARRRSFRWPQLKRGMKGVAYTVFEGVNPEPMQVEILGVLKDSLGPGRDMILARLYGTKPEFTAWLRA